MIGSNLPPGVTTSMLPGNTSEDQRMDALVEEVDAKLAELGVQLDDDSALELAEWLDAKIIEHGAACFSSGMQEATAARQQLECEAVAAERFAFLRRLNGAWHVCDGRDEGHVLFLPQNLEEKK